MPPLLRSRTVSSNDATIEHYLSEGGNLWTTFDGNSIPWLLLQIVDATGSSFNVIFSLPRKRLMRMGAASMTFRPFANAQELYPHTYDMACTGVPVRP